MLASQIQTNYSLVNGKYPALANITLIYQYVRDLSSWRKQSAQRYHPNEYIFGASWNLNVATPNNNPWRITIYFHMTSVIPILIF